MERSYKEEILSSASLIFGVGGLALVAKGFAQGNYDEVQTGMESMILGSLFYTNKCITHYTKKKLESDKENAKRIKNIDIQLSCLERKAESED